MRFCLAQLSINAIEINWGRVDRCEASSIADSPASDWMYDHRCYAMWDRKVRTPSGWATFFYGFVTR